MVSASSCESVILKLSFETPAPERLVPTQIMCSVFTSPNESSG